MAVLKVMPMNQFLLYLADSVIIFGNLYLYRFINIIIVKPKSEVPKSKVPKSRPKGLGLTLESHGPPPHHPTHP